MDHRCHTSHHDCFFFIEILPSLEEEEAVLHRCRADRQCCNCRRGRSARCSCPCCRWERWCFCCVIGLSVDILMLCTVVVGISTTAVIYATPAYRRIRTRQQTTTTTTTIITDVNHRNGKHASSEKTLTRRWWRSMYAHSHGTSEWMPTTATEP